MSHTQVTHAHTHIQMGRSVPCTEYPTPPSPAADMLMVARTLPVVRRLQLRPAVILEGTGRPGVSELGASVQITV